MFEMVHLLAGTNFFLLAFSVLIFDIPRFNSRPSKRHKPVAPARALGSRCLAYPLHDVWELSFFHPFERLPDTLQRLDFIVFDLIPTLSLPFYLAYIVLLFGADAARFLSAIYLLLLWISILNMALAFAPVQPINRSLWFGVRTDLSLLPGCLSEMRAIRCILLGNPLRHVAVR
jgi:hypothetical protein